MALPAETVTGLYLHGLAANASVAYLAHRGRHVARLVLAHVEVRVRELAHGLIALGVGHGDRIGIVADTRVEWTLIDLAALSLGAVTVPAYTVVGRGPGARDARRRGAGRGRGDRAQADRIAASANGCPRSSASW